jgi:hypothetical protein
MLATQHALERGLKRMEGLVMEFDGKILGLMHAPGFDSHAVADDLTTRIFSSQLQANRNSATGGQGRPAILDL